MCVRERENVCTRRSEGMYVFERVRERERGNMGEREMICNVRKGVCKEEDLSERENARRRKNRKVNVTNEKYKM